MSDTYVIWIERQKPDAPKGEIECGFMDANRFLESNIAHARRMDWSAAWWNVGEIQSRRHLDGITAVYALEVSTGGPCDE